MVKLDLKDRKILYELDIDSRQSFKQLAKKVGLSKDAVIYRINRLKKEEIIKYFQTVLDVGKLGFISFRLYLKFQNTTQQKEQEIIDFFKKQKNIIWIASAQGDYNIGMAILVKSIKEMNQLWKEVLAKYLNYIEKRWLTIFTKVAYYTRPFLLDKKINTREYICITEPEEIKIDEKDMRILKILAPNARASVLELAEKTKLNPKTITSRIRQLEEKGIIIGYRTMFDLEKLGYQFFKIFLNLHNTSPTKIKQLREFIRQHSNIIYDNEVLGGGDIEIDVQLKSLTELRHLFTEIKNKFQDLIKNYNYMLFYKEHKYVFLPV